MTVLSRANLVVGKVAHRDAAEGDLHQVWIGPDGETAASDGGVLVVVEPISGRPGVIPEKDGEHGAEAMLRARGAAGVGVLPEVIEAALKNVPRGALRELGYAVMTKLVVEGGGEGIELTSTDLRKDLKVEGGLARRGFPEWRGIFRRFFGWKRRRRICVDWRSLRRLLDVIESACKDPQYALFLEVGVGGNTQDGCPPGLVVRAVNHETGQRVCAYLTELDVRGGGGWLPLSPWEQKSVKPAKKRRRRRKVEKKKGDE